LEEVVKGYDKVDEATGRMLDKIDKASDSWAALGEKWKLNVMTPIAGGLDELKQGFGDLFGIIFSNRKGVNWFNFAGKHRGFYQDQTDKDISNETAGRDRKAKDKQEMERLAADQKAKDEQAAQLKGFEKADAERAAKIAKELMLAKEKRAREAEQQEAQDKRDQATIRKNSERAQARERYKERVQATQENMQGVGVNPDAFARRGGFMGGERAGLAAADRQVRVAEENTRALRELKAAMVSLEYKFSSSTGSFTSTPSLGLD
jgi:hypothetical protein